VKLQIKKAAANEIIKPIMNAQISGRPLFDFFRPEVPDEDRPEDDNRLPDIYVHLLKNIGEMQSHIKQTNYTDQIYQEYGDETENDAVKFMTHGRRVGDNPGNQYSGGVDAVTPIDDVDAEFRGEKSVAINFRTGTEDIHQDTGAIGHEGRERNDYIVMHEIKLKGYYEKQDRGPERQI